MPLEKASPGSPGFSRNIATEVNAGKDPKQAVAIAYAKARGDTGEPFATGPSPINQMTHPLDRLFRAADALYARSDAVATGCWEGVD